MTASKRVHRNRDSDARSFGSVVIADISREDIAKVEYTDFVCGNSAYRWDHCRIFPQLIVDLSYIA